MATILRPGQTPGGAEVRTILKHVIRRIRANWPAVAILVRGDSHYGRPEALDWCEDNGLSYVFGLSGNAALRRLTRPLAEDAAVRRALAGASGKVRRQASFPYAAQSWRRQRRVVARIEASEPRLAGHPDERLAPAAVPPRGRSAPLPVPPPGCARAAPQPPGTIEN